MIPVRVTVAVGRKAVPVEEIQNQKTAGALRQAARNVSVALEKAVCPTHNKGPTNVRLHFDSSGNGDLKYESCCNELAKAISKLV